MSYHWAVRTRPIPPRKRLRTCMGFLLYFMRSLVGCTFGVSTSFFFDLCCRLFCRSFLFATFSSLLDQITFIIIISGLAYRYSTHYILSSDEVPFLFIYYFLLDFYTFDLHDLNNSTNGNATARCLILDLLG